MAFLYQPRTMSLLLGQPIQNHRELETTNENTNLYGIKTVNYKSSQLSSLLSDEI